MSDEQETSEVKAPKRRTYKQMCETKRNLTVWVSHEAYNRAKELAKGKPLNAYVESLIMGAPDE